MTAGGRDELGRRGAAIRRQLGMIEQGEETAAGLGALLDELVYGRVWAREGLPIEDRMLTTVAALTCQREPAVLRRHVEAALDLGLPPTLIQEAVLHCGMYVGLASAVGALEQIADLVQAEGDEPSPSRERPELDELERRGREVMATLHGTRAEDGYARPDALASTLYDTAVDYLYGEIWNRAGISVRQRMICSVAAFTALDLEDQQRKFFRSATNVGLTAAEVIEVIAQTAPYSGFPSALNALAVAETVLADR